jgi:hypothetical protein
MCKIAEDMLHTYTHTHTHTHKPGAHPEFFPGGGGEAGADPEAICYLCVILKNML